MKAVKRIANPWPVAIIVLFVVFFSGLVSFIVFASRQRVDLVRPDYYEQEIRYQQQLDRVERTQAIKGTTGIDYNRQQQLIAVRLPVKHAGLSSGGIHLYRPSDERLDQRLPLLLDAEGGQKIDAKNLLPGLWKVRVQWSCAGEEYYIDKAIVIPARS